MTAVVQDDTTKAPSDLVDAGYYEQGAKWEQSIYRSVTISRGVWRTVAILMSGTAIGAIGLLWAMLPLKQFDVVVLEVDKTTGFVEASRPLQARGDLTQNEAITRANIVRFVRARETYDPKGLRDNFDMASLYSTGKASEELAALYSGSNPANPMQLYGPGTIISVQIKSIKFLNERTAAVRFSTDQIGEQRKLTQHWESIVRYRYTSEPMRNDWRFDNPLGFQVMEYRRDQETVTPEVQP